MPAATPFLATPSKVNVPASRRSLNWTAPLPASWALVSPSNRSIGTSLPNDEFTSVMRRCTRPVAVARADLPRARQPILGDAERRGSGAHERQCRLDEPRRRMTWRPSRFRFAMTRRRRSHHRRAVRRDDFRVVAPASNAISSTAVDDDSRGAGAVSWHVRLRAASTTARSRRSSCAGRAMLTASAGARCVAEVVCDLEQMAGVLARAGAGGSRGRRRRARARSAGAVRPTTRPGGTSTSRKRRTPAAASGSPGAPRARARGAAPRAADRPAMSRQSPESRSPAVECRPQAACSARGCAAVAPDDRRRSVPRIPLKASSTPARSLARRHVSDDATLRR